MLLTAVKYPKTPDNRYFVVQGRLWRCSDPALDEGTRNRWVKQLMDGRRAVKKAKANNDSAAMAQARQLIHQAKVALGEQGPVWWDDGAPDYHRYLAKNTPYAAWYAALPSADPL